MSKKSLLYVSIVTLTAQLPLLAEGYGYAPQNYAYAPQSYSQGYQQPVLQGQVSFVPAGTPVSVIVSEALGSEISSVGQTFNATLSGPIYAGNQLVAGPGSTVQGQIVAVESAARAGKPGSIDIRLTSVITPDGRRYPLSAKVDSNTFSLSADGGRVGTLVKGTAIGAGAGALSGLVGSAISGGAKGKGAAIGTGIGAGIGLLGGAIKKGEEFIMKSGTQVPFVLDQPLQVNAAPSTQVQQYAPQSGAYQPYGSAPSGFAAPAQQAAPSSGQYNPYL